MYLKEIGEERIIRELAGMFSGIKNPRILKSIGDDTSVTLQEKGRVLLATTDILIEGTHFRRDYTPPYLLGRKSLNISISDIAAMGGEPLFFLVSIGLPSDTRKKFLDGLYSGIKDAARDSGSFLVGGNTARLSGKIMVSTTVLGEMDADKVVYRSGARPGDAVYVTGTLGDSALGLKVLKRHGKGALGGPFKNAALRHLDPIPRLKAGQALSSEKAANSMIDISDGFLLDLKRLCFESGAGAVIELERLPLSAGLKRYRDIRKDKERGSWAGLALSGGEDYELLFTTIREKEVKKIGERLKIRMTPVGRIVEGAGVAVIGTKGRLLRSDKMGFEHF